MRFGHRVTYDASPDEVYAMLADPAFRERVCTAMHATEYEVSVETDEAGMSVVVDQVQPAHGIPSFATKFVGDKIQIVQSETWSSPHHATLEVEIPGKPGHLKGEVTLKQDGAGSVETVTGEVKVHIPLLGGRLEKLIGDLLGAALDTEQRVGRAWLAGDR